MRPKASLNKAKLYAEVTGITLLCPERSFSYFTRKNSGVRRTAGEHEDPVTRFLSYSAKKNSKARQTASRKKCKIY